MMVAHTWQPGVHLAQKPGTLANLGDCRMPTIMALRLTYITMMNNKTIINKIIYIYLPPTTMEEQGDYPVIITLHPLGALGHAPIIARTNVTSRKSNDVVELTSANAIGGDAYLGTKTTNTHIQTCKTVGTIS